MSSLPTSITMTKDGGNYRRAMAFSVFVSYGVFLLPAVVLLSLAIINPFWFRDQFFFWTERWVHRAVIWRNRVTYRIYLGTDPELWHALKGDHK